MDEYIDAGLESQEYVSPTPQTCGPHGGILVPDSDPEDTEARTTLLVPQTPPTAAAAAPGTNTIATCTRASSMPSNPTIPQLSNILRNTSESSATRRFRLNAKNLLLTYPQCSTTKEAVLSRIQEFFQDRLDFAIVAREQHQSGDPHLHCLVSLNQRVNFRDPHCLDHLAGQHGSYEAVKFLKKAMEYVTKDGDYVSHGIDPQEIIKKKKSAKSDTVAKSVLEGKTFDDVVEQDPGFAMMNKKKIEEFIAYTEFKRAASRLQPWPTLTPPLVTDDSTDADIKRWLIANIRVQDRAPTAKNLYIYGRTCLGKTTFAAMLSEYLRVYWVPMDEDFYCPNINQYDLAIMDEFRAQKRIQWMNMFCQGFPMTLRVKGSQVLKTKNLPVLVLSNYSLEENYKNTDAAIVDTLRRRFEIIHLTTPINVELN
jgi:hypothetical protein